MQHCFFQGHLAVEMFQEKGKSRSNNKYNYSHINRIVHFQRECFMMMKYTLSYEHEKSGVHLEYTKS